MKKKKHKNLMMLHFINTTIDLIDEIGIKNLTLRKIAKQAGYNSATIYNYFENLDHLVFYAAMGTIKDYSLALPEYLKNSKNAMDTFLMVWECFCDYAYKSPDIYNAIFFPKLDNNLDHYMEEYYEFFPMDLEDLDIHVSTMILRGNIKKRARSTVMGCVDEGYIDASESEKFNDMTLLIFEGFLKRMMRSTSSYEQARTLTMEYIKNIVERFLIREYEFHF